ncbi:hypothetical protein PAMA_011507 [Pampus argenteus]
MSATESLYCVHTCQPYRQNQPTAVLTSVFATELSLNVKPKQRQTDRDRDRDEWAVWELLLLQQRQAKGGGGATDLTINRHCTAVRRSVGYAGRSSTAAGGRHQLTAAGRFCSAQLKNWYSPLKSLSSRPSAEKPRDRLRCEPFHH